MALHSRVIHSLVRRTVPRHIKHLVIFEPNSFELLVHTSLELNVLTSFTQHYSTALLKMQHCDQVLSSSKLVITENKPSLVLKTLLFPNWSNKTNLYISSISLLSTFSVSPVEKYIGAFKFILSLKYKSIHVISSHSSFVYPLTSQTLLLAGRLCTSVGHFGYQWMMSRKKQKPNFYLKLCTFNANSEGRSTFKVRILGKRRKCAPQMSLFLLVGHNMTTYLSTVTEKC